MYVCFGMNEWMRAVKLFVRRHVIAHALVNYAVHHPNALHFSSVQRFFATVRSVHNKFFGVNIDYDMRGERRKKKRFGRFLPKNAFVDEDGSVVCDCNVL